MNSRQRFLAACQRKPVDRTPVWIMRQAGRYLPEYRALKEQYNFLQMVKTPELATQVTLQPLQRFSLDAAILFSDILVIPEAMGQPYQFSDGGIEMAYTLQNANDIAKLTTDVRNHLQYVPQAIRLTRGQLGEQRALIGFSGAPWTLATYMVEGGSSKNFDKIKSLFYSNPQLFQQLLQKLTTAVSDYLLMQVEAGVDAVQIFDSWAGILSETTFWEASGQYIAQIVAKLKGKAQVIVFAKGAHAWTQELSKLNADVLGLDHTITLSRFYDSLSGRFAVQGNLDPILMSTTPDLVKREALRILQDFGSRRGHIFNLGHGILPNARIDCMEALLQTIQQ